MAEEFLQSNIVIATKFSRPETGELKGIHGSLLAVENRLKRLTDKTWKIRLEVDDSQLRQFNLQLQKISTGNLGATGPVAPRPVAPGGGSALTQPRPLGANILARTTSRTFVEGEMTANQVSQKRREIVEGLQRTETQLTETVKDRVKLTTEEVALLAKARNELERRAVMEGARARAVGQQRRLAVEGRQLGQTVRQDIQRGQFPLTMEPGAGPTFFPAIRASERESVARRAQLRKADLDDEAAFVTQMNSLSNRFSKESEQGQRTATKSYENLARDAKRLGQENIANTERSAGDRIKRLQKANQQELREEVKQAKERRRFSTERAGEKDRENRLLESAEDRFRQRQQRLANSATVGLQANRALRARGFDPLQIPADEISAYERRAANTAKEKEQIDDRIQADQRKSRERASRRLNAQRTREEGRATLRQYEDIAKQSGIGQAVHAAVSEGFKAGPSTRVYDTLTNTFKEIHNLTRVTGNALAGYRVEVIRADEATGKLVSRVLEGSAAMRFLGDSIGRAIMKVTLWSVATTAVFATIAAFRGAALAVVDLEEQIAFLARVSSGFAAGSNDFELRYQSAKKLTNQILELTEVYGGNAAKALEAAAIFGRAGHTEQEVLQGVRVSLLAARIAELDIVDSAKLISSAMTQFHLNVDQAAVSLDSLNTLSNNYRVTTNDLLQAISRTGSVFAEHNGRLTELAAITAVVAHSTSRSGSEIGNAIKTISSNLDRLDVQQSIMEKLGVSTVDLAGNSKSLTQVLSELRGQLDGLSSVQQKQLLIQIAGIRQANILISAIRNVDEAIVAENRALLESGSAQEEAGQRSFTFRAALERVSATLIKVAYDAGGPLVRLAAAVLNIIDYLLRLSDAMNGLPVKIAAGVTILYAMSRILQVCRVQLGALYFATLRQVVAQNSATISSVRAGLAYIGMGRFAGMAAVGLRAAGTASAFFGNILRTILSPAGLMSVALLTITASLGAAAQADNTYNEALNSTHEQLARAITAEQNRRQAIDNSVEAITMLIEKQNELRSQGKEAEAAKTGVSIEKISASAGLGLSSGNLGVGDVVAEGLRQKRESIEKEKGNLEQALQARARQIESAQDKLRNAQRYVGTGGQAEAGLPQLTKNLTTLGYVARGSNINAAQERVESVYLQAEKQARQELAHLMEEQEADQKRINDLEAGEFKNTDDAKRQRQGLIAIEQDRLRTIKHVRDMEVEQFQASLSATDEYASLARQYGTVTKESEIQLKNLNHILDLTENQGDAEQLFSKHADRVNQLFNERIKLYQQMQQVAVKSSSESFTDLFGSRNKLYGGAARITEEKTRGLSDTASKYGDELAQIEVNRQQQLERIRANRDIEQEVAGSTLGPAQKKGALEATKLDTQEALNQLKDLEVDKVLAILEAEKNIAVERKKSADEAGRALGALSDEDKLRVRAQAAFFARDPKRKLSFEEQFNMPGESNRITQQFFGGRLQDFSESKGALAGMFSKAGLGVTSDIVKGEKEIGTARGGMTDSGLFRSGLGAAGNLMDINRRLSGAAGGALGLGGIAAGALGPSTGRGVNQGGAATNRIEVGLREGTFDFAPLTDAFREVIQHDLQAATEQMANTLREIIKERDALSARRLPKTSYSTPAP